MDSQLEALAAGMDRLGQGICKAEVTDGRGGEAVTTIDLRHLDPDRRKEVEALLNETKKTTKTDARKLLDKLQLESLSRLFLAHWERNELPTLTPEYQFHPTRKWRLDYALPELKIAVEIHGGTRKQGRHNRADGFAKDREKMNEAQAAGWLVIEITDVMLKEGQEAMDGYLRPIAERIGQ